MTGTVWGMSRRVAAIVAATALLSGCWLQVGFAADHARHNVLESGITRDTVAGLHEAWAVELPGAVNEPVASGGRVYLSRITVGESADVRSLDAATGAEAWQRVVVPPLPPDNNLLINTPATFSGNALWTSWAAPSSAGIHLVSLDPADGSVLTDSSGQVVTTPMTTGQGVAGFAVANSSNSTLVVRDPDTLAVQWTATLATLPVLSVAIARGRLYAPDGVAVDAFAAAGCGAATCAPLWQAPMPDGARIDNVAVAPDGSVVVTSSLAEPVFVDSVTVFDGRTGAQRWTRDVPAIADPGVATVAIAGDTVYVPTRAVPDGAGGTRGDDALVAMSLADGTTQWETPLPAASAVPLVAGGVVYTAAGADLVALDAAGCGAATCDPLLTLPGAGVPRSLGEGRLYTTVFASDTRTTTLRALQVG
jgi:outer membrane protein assembly factor BamB